MMTDPFADHIDLRFIEQRSSHRRCRTIVAEKHHNLHQVLHGAVIFVLADTAIGAARSPTAAMLV